MRKDDVRLYMKGFVAQEFEISNTTLNWYILFCKSRQDLLES
jgi:hypothetical protein